MDWIFEGPGGSIGLPNNSYKPITNATGFGHSFVNYKKGCTRLAAASDKVYQLLAHGRWFSLGTPASSTTLVIGLYELLGNPIEPPGPFIVRYQMNTLSTLSDALNLNLKLPGNS
jgi:hypothetical protein